MEKKNRTRPNIHLPFVLFWRSWRRWKFELASFPTPPRSYNVNCISSIRVRVLFKRPCFYIAYTHEKILAVPLSFNHDHVFNRSCLFSTASSLGYNPNLNFFYSLKVHSFYVTNLQTYTKQCLRKRYKSKRRNELFSPVPFPPSLPPLSLLSTKYNMPHFILFDLYFFLRHCLV